MENVLKTWMINTPTAQNRLKRLDGGISVYLSMPTANPNPAVLLGLSGGGPMRRKDLPQTSQRFQIDVIGKTRDMACQITLGLIRDMDEIPWQTMYVHNGTYLMSAVVDSMRWLPDPDSDVPRYVIDALVTTVT